MRYWLVALCLMFPTFTWADALEDAAQKGDVTAQVELGSRHAESSPANMAEAFKWFDKAAQQGNADAQVMLGVLYENGQGIGKNLEQAVLWYRKAAAQNHGEAQYYLGMMAAYGTGMTKDLVQAYKWLELGSAHDDDRATRARDAVAKLMTPQQIVNARKLAREFKPVK